MSVCCIATNETDRLNALYQLQILDTIAEDDFDDLVELAAQICQTPMAKIAFVDKKRAWFKAVKGFDKREVPRNTSFAALNIDDADLIVVEDVTQHPHFANNSFVTGEDHVRFFASMPVTSEDGFVVGRLCVMDTVERNLTYAQANSLRMLGRQVSNLLKLRSQQIKWKAAEERARNSEDTLQVIYDNAIAALAVVDSKGRIVIWNKTSETVFGWSGKDMMGKSFSEVVICSESRDFYSERIYSYKKTGNVEILREKIDILAVTKTQKAIEVSLSIAPVNLDGETCFICFMVDITERKRVTDELHKQKHFYEIILNNIPTDIAVFDADHKYIFVNPSAIKNEELRKFIIGKDDFEYARFRNRDVLIAENRRKQFIEAKNTNKELRWEDTIADAAGNGITHLRRFFPVTSADGELMMMIGYGMDITDRKIMEEKQSLLVEQLSAQNKQLVDFCNIVSHNLRGPLVNMSMLVKFIEDSREEGEQRHMISMLNPVIDNLHTTFSELVESIQIKQDLEIKSEKILLTDCLDRTVQGLEVEIKNYNAVISDDFEEAPAISFPSKYLYSILYNLVSNALKYQSPIREARINIASRKDGRSIILSVEDNGLGINLEKNKDKIFKIGKVFHDHPNAKGFGLFMTKTQVEAMGGRIWVESTPGVGSTFFIEFKNQF